MVNGSIEELFKVLGYDYREMNPDEIIDVSSQNFEVKSFDHKSNQILFKRILSIVRKNDAPLTLLKKIKDNSIVLKGTPAHRVYDKNLNEYLSLTKVKNILLDDQSTIEVYSETTDIIEPILDMEVEDTNNYFSNGILSHNTTGGNGLKFYASQRLDIRPRVKNKDKNSSNPDEIISVVSHVKVVKNKIAPPFKEVDFNIVFGQGIDKYNDLMTYAVSKDIIEKSGSWYDYEGKRIGQGEATVMAWLRDNPDKYQIIFNKCK